LIEIDGVILTDGFADTTFLLFEVNTAFIDIRDKRNRLGKVNVYRFILRYFLIEWIGDLDRAVLYAGSTTRAFVLYDISRLFNQGDLEVPFFSLYTVNLSIGQDLDVGMPADLDQFG
jgi:hypothetical protein